MADRSVVVRLKAEVDAYVAGMAKAKQATQEFGREITGQGKTSKADLESIGRGAAVMATGLAVGLGLSAKAAIDWESAWAGVTKTVDGSASQMAELEGGLRDLAGVLPATHGEIAAVAEAAGQLGIKREAIEGFTKTMIDLGETTNLTADQAATSMARMANIMQTAPADIDRVASTLVALGNAGASTESEILDMSLRIAGAGKQVGLTEDEVLAFANALSSVGVEAEAGGSAISRVFSTIASAVADGGEELDGFAEVAGVSSEAFATAFRDDAAGATLSFIEGLEGISAEGGNVFATLENLELGDIRVRDALLRAAGAGDLFRESLALGAEEMASGNALLTEAEKRYDTTAAKMEIARNNIVDLGIDIGGVLHPAIAGGAEGISTMARGFGEMPGPMAAVTAGIGGVATAGLGMVAAAALLGPKLMQVRTALLGMGAAGRTAAAAMPWLAAAAAAVATVSYVFGQNAAAAEAAEARVKGFTDAIREAGDVAAGTENRVADLAAEFPGFAELLDATGTSVAEITDALAGSDADFAVFKDGLIGSAEGADVSRDAMASAVFGLDNLREGALGGAADAEVLGRVLEGTGAAAGEAVLPTADLAGAYGMTAEEAEAAAQAVSDFQDQLRAGIDPVFAMQDAISGNADAQRAYSDALAANADAADDNNVSQAELDSLLQDVGASALDVEVAASDMALAMQDGSVSADQFRGQLDRWVAQGTITADQASVLADRFGLTADAADRVDGGRTASLYADDQATPTILAVNARLDMMARSRTARIQVQIDNPHARALGMQLAAGGLVPQHLATGGPVYMATGGPQGTDTVPAWLTPGEFVMRKSAVDRVGADYLSAMNEGRMSPVGASAGGGSYDNSRHTTIQAPITVADRHTAASTAYELRRLSLVGES